jgi:hypothetical protein
MAAIMVRKAELHVLAATRIILKRGIAEKYIDVIHLAKIKKATRFTNGF